MKVLIFDLWGDYGHFRKFYTTSSPLTFSFPPPPTIAGILGAIYGAGKDEYLEVFSSARCKIGLKILKPVKKIRMGINLINTKGNYWTIVSKKNHEPRTQIRTEFLKEPAFRIYLSHAEDNVFEKLVNNIKEHKSFYTVSLGLSELLADFKFVALIDGMEKEEFVQSIELSSVIPAVQLASREIEIESGRKYFREKIPMVIDKTRVVQRYEDVIFETNGKNIRAKANEWVVLENGEYITFF
jgi:CRISPR-associated protein Cas5h